MYAMMAPVEANNVRFKTPDLTLPVIRELTLEEIDYISAAGFLACLGASTATGAAIGALFGNPFLGAGLGAARGILFCPTEAQ